MVDSLYCRHGIAKQLPCEKCMTEYQSAPTLESRKVEALEKIATTLEELLITYQRSIR